MPEYILKLSVAIAIVYLFYILVLRRLTFYQWNRFYLAGYGLLCFVFALINISVFFPVSETGSPIIQQIPVITFKEYATTSGSISFFTVIVIIIALGALIMLGRFVVQLISLYRLRKKSVLIAGTGINLYEAPGKTAPFSYGNNIFINKSLYNDDSLKEIIAHEMVHVKQRHFIDIIFAEILCIILWFNPFAWLMRRAIKQNLEFIADDKVLQRGIEKKQYQYLLLRVMGNIHYSVSHNFNLQSLKNRINMMNRIKTARVQLLRFLFLLPLAAVLLLAFRKQVINYRNTVPVVLQDTIPSYSISVITPKGVPYAIAYDDNGKEISRTRLSPREGSSKKEIKAFEESLTAWQQKYGAVPPPPLPPKPGMAVPPPVPTPPAPPKEIVIVDDKVVEAPLPPKPPAAPRALKPPTPPPAPKLPDDIRSLSINSDNTSINEGGNKISYSGKAEATIIYKNGDKVIEDISTPEKKKAFEKKHKISVNLNYEPEAPNVTGYNLKEVKVTSLEKKLEKVRVDLKNIEEGQDIKPVNLNRPKVNVKDTIKRVLITTEVK